MLGQLLVFYKCKSCQVWIVMAVFPFTGIPCWIFTNPWVSGQSCSHVFTLLIVYIWVQVGQYGWVINFSFQLSTILIWTCLFPSCASLGLWQVMERQKRREKWGSLSSHFPVISFSLGQGERRGLRKIGCGCHWDLWTPTLFHNLANLSFQGKKYWFATNTWNKSEFRTILQFTYIICWSHCFEQNRITFKAIWDGALFRWNCTACVHLLLTPQNLKNCPPLGGWDRRVQSIKSV